MEAAVSVEVDEALVLNVAKWLAHSDKVMYSGKRAVFRDGADRYWTIIYEAQKTRWLGLARALLTNDFASDGDQGASSDWKSKPRMPGMVSSIAGAARKTMEAAK